MVALDDVRRYMIGPSGVVGGLPRLYGVDVADHEEGVDGLVAAAVRRFFVAEAEPPTRC